jgi:hypothetical protein
MVEKQPNIQGPPTIYDLGCAAGVSIASVSQVLNGHHNTRLATRDRVLQAVAALEYLPDGAAWAPSARLKEVINVVSRRVPQGETSEATFAAQPPCRCLLSPSPASRPERRAKSAATAAPA